MATMQDARRSSRQNLSHLSLGKQRQFRRAANPRQITQMAQAIELIRKAMEAETEAAFKYNASSAYRALFNVLSNN